MNPSPARPLLPLILALGLGWSAPARAADPAAGHGAAHTESAASAPGKPASAAASSGNPMAEKIKAALAGTVVASKKMTVVVEDKEAAQARTTSKPAVHPAATGHASAAKAHTGLRASKASAHAPATAGHGSEPHWTYDGDTGPQAWGQLKPEFNVCAIGKRQSPIAIESGATLQGPAEPLQFAYSPSNASVVNNGHTIQVDVQGDNQLTVRGSVYRLLQFHFHTPSEEQVNGKRYPLVAHLVHKNAEGQLAVVAVLMDEGESNPMMDTVWTYMPLDAGDRVRMPQGLLDVNALLPKDQRYYQFMGSLTTPPCSENVLWMVLKTPITLSKAQHTLFAQLYPHNARPVQPLNGRVVREAQ